MQKIVKLNRAFLYCCMVVLFCLRYEGYAAPTQGKPVSITIKNSSLADVLRQVSKKSGLYIYFQDADLAGHRNVSLDVKNKPVESVLHDLLDERGLAWVEVSENTIAVKKKPETDERKVEVDTVTTITVTGKVVDEKGEPVIGATVMVKGSKIGTTTNPNGDFVLSDIRANASIIVSNISFLTIEVPVRGRRAVGQIQLKGKVGELDEIVVIPYGTTTRRLNVGNVVSIKAEDIEKQPVNNPLYALQGRAAGLQVTPTTGLSGGAVNVSVRGRNSLGQQSNPLIVVNGLPVLNNISGLGHTGFTNFSGNQMSALSFINPNDIESIEILKDADATSIYGSRGANGVILITTKKGKEGEVKININAQTGWGSVEKKVDVLNTQQYLEIRKEAIANSGIDLNAVALRLRYTDVKLWDQNRYTDWQNELIGGISRYDDFQGSISGGTSTVQYILGGNYHKETTVFPGDNADKKGSAYISLTGYSPNQRFKATINASYLADKNTLPGVDFTDMAIKIAPNSPTLYKDDGSLNWELMPSGAKSWDNPMYELNKIYDARVNNLTASTDISYKLFSFLTLRTTLGYNELRGKSFSSSNPFKDRSPDAMNDPASSVFNTTGVKNINVEPQIIFDKNFGKGVMEVLVGGSWQMTSTENQNIVAFGFTSDALLRSLSAAADLFATNASSQYKYNAIFGRVKYTWDGKYLISLNARRDGSSRFGPASQFGNFGSIGAAWILSHEDFFKRSLPFISFGKLRFSYGSAGNDGIGDYGYLERYQPITNLELYQGVRGYRTLGFFNAYYAWEVTKKMEFGLEAGALKDRILFTISYFRNRSNNQLLGNAFPATVGPGSSPYNLPALIQNSGLEVTVNTENVKLRNFTWSTSFNFTRNRNKLISYPDLENSSYYRDLEIGQPFSGVVRSYNFNGVDPQTGRYQFTDIDGKNTFDPQNSDRLDAGKYLRIMTDPKFYGGISHTVTYKKFSLDFFVQYVKQRGIDPLSGYVKLAGVYNSNLPVEYLNRWKREGDVTNIQKVFSDYFSNAPSDFIVSGDNVLGSSFVYTDASFIRLKNFSLSYSIPDVLKQRLNIANLKVYVQGQNLITITKYKGLDPESQSLTSLPPLKVLTVGIQAAF
ncbi:SusC/RagA family TonB-linked outer membrane protein [Chitinophaga agri]|uniref:SusC/RagA family TonB-linked outer membrane protein n=1 Tax=Chitinophaga agri TaxID=2703787 RepID=A0A6B9ZHA2_9BACT|nr:SusC/RagA family TonB-linked outer membrane protein [Chitinophaga agri]QHS61139.1 SusC/RagA family TonB-linked outer membrane protein [Chitinophaga agri]